MQMGGTGEGRGRGGQRCSGGRETLSCAAAEGRDSLEEGGREQPYRRPSVIGIGVKVQWVDSCAA